MCAFIVSAPRLIIFEDGGQAFLDACSSEAWFTRVTTLLSGSDKLSQNTLEKLSIILQRLSKNRSVLICMACCKIHMLVFRTMQCQLQSFLAVTDG